MTKHHSIARASSILPAVVREAEAGEEIELMRRGRPVAVVLALRRLERLRADRPRFSDAYHAFLEHHSLPDVGLDDAFFASLRAEGAGRKVEL